MSERNRIGNAHVIKRIGPGYSKKLIINVLRHSQGDPGELEELWVQAIAEQIPYWQLASRRGFVYQTKGLVLDIIGRSDKHAKVDLTTVIDGEKEPEHSLLRLHRRINLETQNRAQFKKTSSQEELVALIPALTVELVSRDWYYLVQREGRPKDGIKKGDSYDPNFDKWLSFIAYYALWTQKIQTDEGEEEVRRSTGVHQMNPIYEMIGQYLEYIRTLGRNDALGPNRYPRVYETDKQVYEMLMEMLAVYNKRQKDDLNAPERQVWKEDVDAYLARQRR